ncbi:hypothetical protein ACSBR1_005566 [Camellia fascicularis]
MANDGQKEKIGDDIPAGSGKHIDPNIEEDNCNEETWDKNLGERRRPGGRRTEESRLRWVL